MTTTRLFTHSARVAICIVALLVTLQCVGAAPDDQLGMALMGAMVGSDGALIRGSGVTSAARLGQGSYLVQFDRDVSQDDPTGCYWAANAYSQDVIITVTRQPPRGLGVATKYNGNFVDSPFSLIVYCAR